MRIVWSCFRGRYGDNPRYLFEEIAHRPGLEHVWIDHPDGRSVFPAGIDRVVLGSDEAIGALQLADLVVANTHIEMEWDKSSGTTYLQTWHGTPLKTVHHDVLWAPPGTLERLDRDIARWDLLLSPNADSTPRLRGAFGFLGPVHETGYPRNDLLVEPRQQQVRDDVRRRLGASPDQVVVLYAPTWRDPQGYDEALAVPVLLDLERVGAELGEDHLLLVRGHNLVAGRWEVPQAPWLREVTFDFDVAELYAAADVLVTDYSSTTFDFAATGRPMIFFAPDLEHYRDHGRGFYFDPLPVYPGPVVRTTDEVVAALRDVGSWRPSYAERYDAFQKRYCALEDGRATERVLDLLGL